MISFSFTQKKGENFVPASVIYRYAQEHNYRTFYFFDSLIVKIPQYGGNYSYDHYNITPIDEENEKVTIYLRLIEKI